MDRQAMQFEGKVNEALAQVRKVLDTTRAPTHPAGVQHHYDDKFILAELGVKATTASLVNILESSTAWTASLPTLMAWAKANKAVSLRFTSSETCAFDKTTTREVESPTRLVKETSSDLLGRSESTTKTVTTVTEHFWKFAATWQLVAYCGADPAAEGCSAVLKTGGGALTMMTTGDKARPPAPSSKAPPARDVEATWLVERFQQDGGALDFKIDRTAEDCRTPSRNADVEAAAKFFRAFSSFAAQVQAYQERSLYRLVTQMRAAQGAELPAGQITSHTLFPMAHAMFALDESQADADADADADAATLTLSTRDFASFVGEHKRSLGELTAAMAAMFPPAGEGGLLNANSATFTACLHQASLLSSTLSSLVAALESMLRSQLTAAIGKAVGPDDFAEYMEFHNRKLFRANAAPKPFCHSIRRPGRFPEGTLSIEAAGAGNKPINTTSVERAAQQPMRFPLSAAASVEFMGTRHVHAAMLYSFSGGHGTQLQLMARARQFSSFILLAGKIVGADAFEPTAAMIVKNRDDLRIPLVLETVPTAKEFKDAIQSMSPEQQRFAQAFRGMQLASTLFACVVIQIKPQMEKLLNLPDGALTKEIKLTEDLMSLFIDYQIPADLVSFEGGVGGAGGAGEEDASVSASAAKLAQVKGHVAQVQAVIDEARQEEIRRAAEAALKEKLRKEAAEAARQAREEEERHREHMRAQVVVARSAPVARCAASGGGGGRGGGTGARMMKMSAAPMAMRRSRAASGSMPPPPPNAMAYAMESACMDVMDSGEANSKSMPSPPAPAEPQQQQQQQPSTAAGTSSSPADAAEVELDYTALPATLDKVFETHDPDSAVRATKLSLGEVWTRTRRDGLLSKPAAARLAEDEQKTEMKQAIDLLDALTRSGALTVDCADLHVVLAATHCFDDTLVETVIRKNANPIESVERTTLAMASAVHGVPAKELVASAQLQRVATYSPALMQ